MSPPEEEDHYHRIVRLPLESMDKCHVCSSTNALRLCSSCGERLYCSTNCQSKDWSTHKPICGKTDRIELGSYYPLLALIMELCHHDEALGIHPALERQVINDVNPGSSPYRLPNGYEAKVIMMGEKKTLQELHENSRDWWPLARSDNVAWKLKRRVIRGGNLLPITTAVCVALLAELYTTASGPDEKTNYPQHPNRVRFKSGSSPIADFGVATGFADVKSQDRLAFFDVNDGTITVNQDPRVHYWIYFTTIRGEIIYLDCGLFTFDMCMMIPTQPYVPPHISDLHPFAPAFYRGTLMRHNAPPVQHERKRVSALRDESLRMAVMHSTMGFDDEDVKLIHQFMKEVSGSDTTKKEDHLAVEFAVQAESMICRSLSSGEWKKFPAEPDIGIESDPGQMDAYDDEAEDWEKHMKEWRKKSKKERKKERAAKGRKA